MSPRVRRLNLDGCESFFRHKVVFDSGFSREACAKYCYNHRLNYCVWEGSWIVNVW